MMISMPSQHEQQQQHFDNEPVTNDDNDAITMTMMPSQQQQFHNQPAISFQ